jgi:regulator of replication initiation timing
VNGLKKIVREAREENDALKAEVARLKKSLKYTKLNEVEVERQTIYEENKKLAKLVHQYENELTSRLRQDQEVEHL